MKVLEMNLPFWSLGRLNGSIGKVRDFWNKSREKEYLNKGLIEIKENYSTLTFLDVGPCGTEDSPVPTL